MRAPLAVLALALLTACSPEYDWREVRSSQDGWAALLPGKPASLTRRIRLDGLDVPMSMQGAKVGETTFTIAVAGLPDAAPATREKALAAMRAGMLRNIAAPASPATEIRVAVVDAAGAKVGEAPGWALRASGSAQGRPMQMHAAFAARGARAWQWVVLGPEVDAEQARTFTASFRLLQEPP
jgi:hypothetical protein